MNQKPFIRIVAPRGGFVSAHLHHGNLIPCTRALVLALPSDPGLEALEVLAQRLHLKEENGGTRKAQGMYGDQ